MRKVKLADVAIERKENSKCKDFDAPTVGLEHLIPGEIELTHYDTESSDNTFTKVFKEGDVLFGRRRAYLKKASVARFNGICSGDITVIQALPEQILPELLPFVIQNDKLFEYAVEKSAGSLSPRVKWEQLKEFSFNLPEMNKQLELANLLWAINSTKKAYQGLLKKTDDLVKSQFIEMIGSVDTNIHKWTKYALTDVCDFQGGSQPPKKDWISGPNDGYIRMLQIRDFTQEGKFVPEYVKITPAIKTCEAEDILIGRYGASVGKILTGQAGAYNVAIMRSIPNTSLLNRTYLRQYFFTPYFQEYILAIASGRGAQAGFNKDDLSHRDILVPPVDVQSRYEAFVQQSDKSKFELEQSLSRLSETYNTIIKENLG